VSCGTVSDTAQAQAVLSTARKTLSGAEYLLADFHQVQGRIYLQQGRRAEASEQYQRSLALNRALDNYASAARNVEALLALDKDDTVLTARWTLEAAALKANAAHANAWRPTDADTDANRENARGVQCLCLTEGNRPEILARARSAFLAASQLGSNCWYDLNLAYTCWELGEWAAAAAAIESSLRKGADWWHVPRLRELLQECRTKHVDTLQELGDRHWQNRADHDARRAFQDALEAVEPLEEDWKRRADIHARLAVACTLGGDAGNGLAHFTAAVQCRRNDRPGDAAERVGESCGDGLVRDLEDFKALDLAWAAIGERSDPDTARELEVARRRLVHYFENLFQFADIGDVDEFLPLRLTLGEHLVPEDTSTERWSLFTTLIPAFRSRVEADTGMTIPGIRVISGLSAGNYTIEINGGCVARGAVEVDARFCPAPGSALTAAGIQDIALDRPAAHPTTGEPGHWLVEKYWKPAEDAALELWEPLAFVVTHVEAMAHRHLDEFLDIDLAQGLVNRWTQATIAPSHNRGRGDGRVLRELLPILRALLQERVPMTSGLEILKAVQRTDASRSHAQLLFDVRRDLRSLLPGNRPSTEKLPLPGNWEQALAAAYRDESGDAQLALTPEQANRFLGDVREAMQTGSPGVVLLVNHAALRPFVRRLIQGEFPDLMVLAADELVPPSAGEPVAPVAVTPVESEAGTRP
jgi:tetratricopeptide (TPR) repeat protein